MALDGRATAPEEHRQPSLSWDGWLPILGEEPELAGFGRGLAAAANASLRRIADTWWSIVFRDTTSRSAISPLRRPSATRASTSCSRAVKPAGFDRVAGRGPRGSPRAPRPRN